MPKNGKSKKKEARRIEGITVDNLFLELAPQPFEPGLYKEIRKIKEIEEFCRNFGVWNKHVPWLVYADSQPHKDLMAKLTALMRDKVGENCADFGCGYGEFLTHLLQLGECTIKKYFAIDLDWEPLVSIPRRLQYTSFVGKKIFFVHTASMFESPLWDESVDSVISSLGAIMYTWAWFNEDGEKIASNREALKFGLKDIHRILKPGGYFALSAPLPNPNWRKVRNQSFKHLVLNEFEPNWHWFKRVARTIYHGTKAAHYSDFMLKMEREGRAHYLSSQEWKKYLEEAGFEIVSVETDCFAGQGVIVIARKK